MPAVCTWAPNWLISGQKSIAVVKCSKTKFNLGKHVCTHKIGQKSIAVVDTAQKQSCTSACMQRYTCGHQIGSRFLARTASLDIAQKLQSIFLHGHLLAPNWLERASLHDIGNYSSKSTSSNWFEMQSKWLLFICYLLLIK